MELLETGRGGPLFRWLGEPLALDLANTVLVVRPGDARDLLATGEGLSRWLELERERLGDWRPSRPERLDLLELRGCVRRLLAASAQRSPLSGDDVGRLNELSAAAACFPRLGLASGVPKCTRLTTAASTGTEALARIARSAIELLGGDDRARVRICAAPNCGMFFVANRSKPGQRWCCAACGNRARVASHYRRRRGQASTGRVGRTT